MANVRQGNRRGKASRARETEEAKLQRLGLREYCKRKLEERIGRAWTPEFESELEDELCSDSEARRQPDQHWREANALAAAIDNVFRVMRETLPADMTGGAVPWQRRADEWGSADMERDAWMDQAWSARAPDHPGLAKWVARRRDTLEGMQAELSAFTSNAAKVEPKGNAEIVHVFDTWAKMEWRNGLTGFLGTGRNACELDFVCLSVLLLGDDSPLGQPAVEAFNRQREAIKKIRKRSARAKTVDYFDGFRRLDTWLKETPGRATLHNLWGRSNPLHMDKPCKEQREAIEALEARGAVEYMESLLNNALHCDLDYIEALFNKLSLEDKQITCERWERSASAFETNQGKGDTSAPPGIP